MKLVLIADTFPPLRTSGAVQLRDLAREFLRQGHELSILLPAADQQQRWLMEDYEGCDVWRLKAPRTKDIGYIARTIGEFLMPFSMLWALRKSPLRREHWDGVIWYAPSIFHGPLVRALKKRSGCKGYLIIRDIFPQWALDMGLMRRGLAYYFFELIAQSQYHVADIIGVQTPGNLHFFNRWKSRDGRKVEILHNWLGAPASQSCAIRLSATPLAGRKIFVYAGNMGVAQGMDILLDLASSLRRREDIGFLFVGRGSDAKRLRAEAQTRCLDNVLFYDEIHPDEIPDLYAQCVAGMVALDPRHKSHNIPGKFLTYMQCGLPVLASVNPNNDLADLIREARVGRVCEKHDVHLLTSQAEQLLAQIEEDAQLPQRCREVFARHFSVAQAVHQIVAALSE